MAAIVALPLSGAELRLSNAGLSADTFSFSFNSVAGTQYRIERAIQISQPAWSTLTTLTASGATTPFSESVVGSASRLYRVFVPATSVYSTNAVGFLTVSLVAGSNWVVNPFNAQRLDTLIPSAPDGTAVSVWIVSQNHWDIPHEYWDGMGWLDPDFNPSNLILPQNEGFLVFAPQAFSVTFVGEVPAGGAGGTAPAIASQPQSQTVSAGGTASFTVSATGTAPLSYRWQKNSVALTDGGNLSGATTPTLTLSNVQTNDAGNYRVVITNSVGSITSAVAALTVTACTPPTITAGPVGLTRCEGESAAFSVTASGTGLTYQWRKNGGNISGATASNYTIAVVAPGDASSYDCLVSNACGAAAASENLAQNPGFEQGTTGWFALGPCTLTATTSQAHSGQGSAYVQGRTGTWNGPAQSLLGVLQPSGTYGISVWLRVEGSTSQSVGVTISQIDGGGTAYWNVASVTASPGQWVQLKGSFTLNVTGTLTELTLYAQGPAAGVNFYADEVVVERLVESGQNLAQNPGFEQGPTGWFVFGPCSLAATTSQAHSGQRSAYIQGRTDTWNGPAQSLLGVLAPSTLYRLHAWVRLETASSQPFELAIKQTDSSGTAYPWGGEPRFLRRLGRTWPATSLPTWLAR